MEKISNYTEQFLNKLPYWFKMKKNPTESVGADFLNVFGLEYDDMRYILEYAFKQVYINQMDINYLNKAYKAYIPSSIDLTKIKCIRSNSVILDEVTNLTDFFNITFDYYENPDNYNKDIYIIDKETEIIYLKKEYDINEKHKYGKVYLITQDDKEYELEILPHAVWNFFDEIGLLIDCYRLENESNFDYKNRLLDVFKHIRNSSKDGLLNAISNELGIRKTIKWEDTNKDLVIKDNMVVANKIKVNGEYINIDEVYIDEHNNIVIKKDNYVGFTPEVSYVHSIELHALNNKNDKKLDKELFYLDNTATSLLKNYFNKIHSVSPIVWDKFIWDRAYWNIIDKDIGGIAFIPNLLDGKINGFEHYLE